MKRGRGATLAGALGTVVGVVGVLREPLPTTVAGICGYILGGLLVGVLWTMAGVAWVRARRSP